jgi:hypothetical protein
MSSDARYRREVNTREFIGGYWQEQPSEPSSKEQDVAQGADDQQREIAEESIPYKRDE